MSERESLIPFRPQGLPWVVSDTEPWCVYAADGRLVAYCGPRPPDPNPVRAEQDAKAIVQAANAAWRANENS